jgi:hypothetical protein
MALLEDTLGGWSGGIVIGFGALVAAPFVAPVLSAIVRPVVRTVVGGGLAIVDGVSGIIAEGYDQVSDLVAEARAEIASASTARPRSLPAGR